MKSQRIPMPFDEFDALPQKLGWKYEYWSGTAHITPRHTGVVTARVKVTPRAPVNTPCQLRPVVENDMRRLIPAYFAAFKDTFDYCDWTLRDIKAAAQRNLGGYFAGKRGVPLPASHVAVANRKIIVGGAFIVQQDGLPLLDLLFVRPQWRRKGVATALATAALNTLHAAGAQVLRSRFWLGNEESRAWHHRFGFVDEPDLTVTRLYYYHVAHILERDDRVGKLSQAEREALSAERARLERQLDLLHQAEREMFERLARARQQANARVS